MSTRVASAGSALLGVYRHPPQIMVEGRGGALVDEGGRRYLDFTSGIGVNALGYDVPEIRSAVEEALERGLVHTSNLFRTRPAEALAELLVELSFPGRVFFCNSGAEAGEAAFKFARRWARTWGGEEKHEVVALRGSFHGRLFGTLAATDRPAYRAPFEPLMPGVRFVDPDEPGALDAAVDPDRTAAVIAEPVQGESGVRVLPAGFLDRARQLCSARDAALIFDEVQCGLGRTGDLFAHQASGVTPDLLLLAKPLAGGLPMGAVIVSEAVAEAVRPGDHATTFGGGPLVASVARAVVRRLSDPSFLDGVRARGSLVGSVLKDWPDALSRVREVRGRGLMWGVEIEEDTGAVVDAARERGLLVVSAGPRVVRLLPPLSLEAESLERGLGILREVLE